MTTTPMAVQTRPFAIEPLTKVMLPDGIFDNALYHLDITVHYTNTSGADLSNVSLYLESIGDPGIAVTARTFTFDVIPAGASVLLGWSADFENAAPGKPFVSFVAQADGFTAARSIRQIFVSQTRYDETAKKWTTTIPEGRLEISHITAFKPADGWSRGDCCCDGRPKGPGLPGPEVPTGITMEWFPNPSYEGQFGDLPFQDPWWKIVAIIVAAIAALVGVIAAALGGGTFLPGVKGTYDDDPNNPSVQCCTPSPGGSFTNNATTVAGVAGVICSVAIAVAFADDADPIFRGQQNTHPAAGELTVSEKVVGHWTYDQAPNAGVPYTTHVAWTYERRTTGATYTFEVEEDRTNIHVVDDVEIDTPANVHNGGLLWAEAKFTKPGGALFAGPELYTICFFKSPGPDGLYFQVPLVDDGRGRDTKAGDGVYTASLSLELAQRQLLKQGLEAEGVWRVFVYAQEVNLTKPGTPPLVAAQTVGGNFVSSAVSITFDPSLPCPLKSQASITVT